jgi:hypothetical protein
VVPVLPKINHYGGNFTTEFAMRVASGAEGRGVMTRRVRSERQFWGISSVAVASNEGPLRVEPCRSISVPRTAGFGALPPFAGTAAKDPLPPAAEIQTEALRVGRGR